MSKKIILTDKAPAPIGPYSQAVQVGDLLFVSGQIPVDPASGQIPDGAESQARQALTNLSEVLKAAGSSCDQVVKTTVFIQNIGDFGTINDVYAEYFTTEAPARSCVEVAKLPKGVLLEIEAIAVLK